MARTLRKTITFPILDEEVSIDIDFRIVEATERAYRDAGERIRNADQIAIELGTLAGMSRSRIADVLLEWMRIQRAAPEGLSRSEIREAIVTAKAETLNLYAGCIQGAILYALQYINEKQLRKLEAGKALDGDEEDDDPADPDDPDAAAAEKKTTARSAREGS